MKKINIIVLCFLLLIFLSVLITNNSYAANVTLRNLSNAVITLSATSYPYSGLECKPTVTVKYNNNIVSSSNYTVKYSNNINIGTASVTITAKSSSNLYTGSKKATFKIVPKSIINCSITDISSTYEYTGQKIIPKPTIKNGSITLVQNTDYTLAYENNTVGKAKIIITGKGKYKDTAVRYFQITFTKEDVVNFAKKYLGKPYAAGQAGPNSFDCSGFTKYVYGHFGYTLSHSSSSQASAGVAVDKSNIRIGDLLYFSTPNGHVGIYIGNNQFIHAGDKKTGVIITSFYNDPRDGDYYGNRLKKVRRIL